MEFQNTTFSIYITGLSAMAISYFLKTMKAKKEKEKLFGIS